MKSYSLMFMNIIATAVIAVSSASFAAGSSDWAKFKVKDVQLGETVASIEAKGYKTTPYDVGVSQDHQSWIKIFDPCAKEGTCEVAGKNETHVVKDGQPEHPMSNPVEYLEVRVTNGAYKDARVEGIRYFFPRQFLKEDSPLGKTLIAKYGSHCTDSVDCYRTDPEMFDEQGGGKMTFNGINEEPNLQVYCAPDGYSGYVTKECHMFIDDSAIFKADQKRFSDMKTKDGEKNQPKPPSL